MEASLKEKTAKGLFWGGIGNGAMQLLNLVFGIFLARLLSTTDYGMVAVLTIFSAMAGIFSESGFILALVNKKEVKHEDYNSVFWFNISIGASLYLILFLCAPFIADFYHTPELTRLARFQFLSFFIGSFGTAPTAYFFRNLMVIQVSVVPTMAGDTGELPYKPLYTSVPTPSCFGYSLLGDLLFRSAFTHCGNYCLSAVNYSLPRSSLISITTSSPHCWDVSTPSSKPVTTHREASGRRWDIPPFSE